MKKSAILTVVEPVVTKSAVRLLLHRKEGTGDVLKKKIRAGLTGDIENKTLQNRNTLTHPSPSGRTAQILLGV